MRGGVGEQVHAGVLRRAIRTGGPEDGDTPQDLRDFVLEGADGVVLAGDRAIVRIEG